MDNDALKSASFQTPEPARMIDRLRQIWPDIMTLRNQGLLYKQIVELLPDRYGITVSYASFMSSCRLIRRRPQSVPVAVPRQLTQTAAVGDVFAEAKAKHARTVERNRILDGKAGGVTK